MKYAVNHPWKFEKNGGLALAWLSGFLQATMVMTVESVNYIALITNNTHVDIVMDFLALAVIADFDDFFYKALFDKEFKQVITDKKVYENFLVQQTTTSFDARWVVKGNRIKRQDVEIANIKDFPQYDRDNPNHSISR